MGTRKKTGIWITWAVIWPLALWWVYETFGFKVDGQLADYLLFIFLVVLVALFPIQVRGTDLVVTQGVLLAIFLEFGLFAEVVAQQLSTFALLAFLRVGRNHAERYPINLLMFFAVSLISGLAYFAAGGETGSPTVITTFDFVPIFVYIICVFSSNHFLLFAIRRFLMKQEGRFIGRDLVWEAFTTVLMIPFAIVLYLLYVQMHLVAILFVGIPLISLSIMLRLYHSSGKINNLLQKSNEIGQQLSVRLEVEGTLDFFMEKIPEIFNIDLAYILDTDEDNYELLSLRRVYEKEQGLLRKWPNLKMSEGISGHVWNTGMAVRYSSRKQWRQHSLGFLPGSVQSVVSVPVRRNQEIVGIVTLASMKKNAYDRHHLMTLEILANFLAVAVENARNYEKTKKLSERDPLTNLYNYRYFIDLLDAKFRDGRSFPFSIILLDLDHFKEINDTYGHESGNDVLCELSERLVDLVANRGTVARYGGEEFVIVLDKTDLQVCVLFAEEIRKRIAEKPFKSKGMIAGRHEKQIRVTASIGVAVAPLHGEDSLSLIRNADRAMYTGAKQKGKNRVSAYIS